MYISLFARGHAISRKGRRENKKTGRTAKALPDCLIKKTLHARALSSIFSLDTVS
jgi:hypothetical protein